MPSTGRPRGIGQHDVGRQVLILGAQPVGDPGGQGRPAGDRHAGVHRPDGLLVVAVQGEHRADHGEVIGVPGDVRQRLGELQARPAVPGEPIRAAEQVAGELLVVGHFLGRRLAVVFGEHRLGVEQIDVARPAVHEELDDGLGPRGLVRGARPDVKRPASGRRCLGPHAVDSPRSAARTIPPKPPPRRGQRLAASRPQRASGRAIGVGIGWSPVRVNRCQSTYANSFELMSIWQRSASASRRPTGELGGRRFEPRSRRAPGRGGETGR